MPPKKRAKHPARSRPRRSRRAVTPPLEPLSSPSTPVSEFPQAPIYAPAGWNNFLLILSLGIGLICFFKHQPEAETIFLILALLLVVSRFWVPQNPNQIMALLVLGWILAALSLGTYHNFQYAFSFIPGFTLSHPVGIFALGMGLLAAYWRFLPSADGFRDIPKVPARICFWIIISAAAFLRMYHLHEAYGSYWDDPATCIADPRTIMDFHWRPMLLPLGSREPFFSYFIAGLWSLMPDAYAIFVQRLGGALIDLTGVWLFYLLGKEVGGRRVGLVAAALGATSKCMIINDLIGMTSVTVPVTVALILLMTFRLFKNPDWNHFIKWGLALGFAPYNYTPVRPWLLFLVTAVFLWIWFYKEKGQVGRWGFFLGTGTLVTWYYLFFLKNNYLPLANPWVAFWDKSWIGITVAAFLWILFFGALVAGSSRRPPSTPSLFPRWFFGLFLAALIIYPLASNPMVSNRLSFVSIFHDNSTTHFEYKSDILLILIRKIWLSLQTMFLAGQDRDDMNIPGEGFFEYHYLPVFALGFVSLLIRPNWIRVFLLMGGFVGISAHVLSFDPHNAKMIAALPSLSVLSGLAVQQACSAWEGFSQRKERTRFLLLLLMAGYFAWAVWGTFDRIWKHFSARNRTEKTVSIEVAKYAPQNKVYIAFFANFVSSQTQTFLNQGYEVCVLNDKNPIFLKTGEKMKDVVVLMSRADQKTQSAIEAQFKNVSWEDISNQGHNPGEMPPLRRAIIPASSIIEAQFKNASFEVIDNEGRVSEKAPYLLRAVIPASKILQDSYKLFYLQPVSDQNWTRDFLVGQYILGYGLIAVTDSVDSPYEPVPSWNGSMVRVQGAFKMPVSGRVRFRVESNNYAVLKVDGQAIFSLKPYQRTLSDSRTVDLKTGIHQVDYATCFIYERAVPKIFMSVDGGADQLMGGDLAPPLASPARAGAIGLNHP